MSVITFVVEYENEIDEPTIKALMPVLGGKLIAVQFDNALDKAQDEEEE